MIVAKFISNDSLLPKMRGGQGSGNFGHEGRPGSVGGSGDNTSINEDSQEFLHGTTSEFVDGIKLHGLLASKMGQGQGVAPEMGPHVFFSNQRPTAEYWGENAVENNGGKVMILTIRVPKSAQSRISEDPDAKYVKGNPVAFRFEGDIPPEWITNIEEGKGW